MKLVITSYRLGEMSLGLGETVVMTTFRLKEISGGFGDASSDPL